MCTGPSTLLEKSKQHFFLWTLGKDSWWAASQLWAWVRSYGLRGLCYNLEAVFSFLTDNFQGSIYVSFILTEGSTLFSLKKKKKAEKKKKVSCSSCRFSAPQRGTSRGGAPSFPSDLSFTGTFHSFSKFKGQNRMCKWLLSSCGSFPMPPIPWLHIPHIGGSVLHSRQGPPAQPLVQWERDHSEHPIALILTVYDVLHFSTVERSDTG